jgi:hypothetical protein
MSDRLPASFASAVGTRGTIVIRSARGDDAGAIGRLAQLTDRRLPTVEMLVAEVDGAVVAAAPLDGGLALTDPFSVTFDVTELLALRATQLRAAA